MSPAAKEFWVSFIEALYPNRARANKWFAAERIGLDRIARAVGTTDERVARLQEQAAELHYLATAFAR
jgi:hypothetical protein